MSDVTSDAMLHIISRSAAAAFIARYRRQSPASGGPPTVLLKVDEERGERFFRHPSFLPSGKGIVFTIGMAGLFYMQDRFLGVIDPAFLLVGTLGLIMTG